MNNVEKIRDEINRLKNNVGSALAGYDMGEENGAFLAYEKMLSFIDSLPEETSKDLDEAASDYVFKEHKSPLSMIMHIADLKAETQYINDCESCFKAGAEWQKEQMIIKLNEMNLL